MYSKCLDANLFYPFYGLIYSINVQCNETNIRYIRLKYWRNSIAILITCGLCNPNPIAVKRTERRIRMKKRYAVFVRVLLLREAGIIDEWSQLVMLYSLETNVISAWTPMEMKSACSVNNERGLVAGGGRVVSDDGCSKFPSITRISHLHLFQAAVYYSLCGPATMICPDLRLAKWQ